MSTRWARVGRGLAVAAFATFVAALSHTIGGGAAPGMLAVALSLAFSMLLCIAVAGRRLSLGRTAVAVALTQSLLHALYSVSPPAGSAAAPGHVHGAVPMFAEPTGRSPLDYDVAMLAAHAIAAVVTIAAVRHGDRALRAIARIALLAVRVPLPASVAPPPTAAPPVPFARRILTPPSLVVLSALRHRGPPAALLAAH